MPDSPSPDASTGRILVVDDEPNLRHMLTLLLSRDHWDVSACASGAEALAHLRQHDCDLVLCDVRMPDLDGLELLDALREEGTSATLVMMSAYGSDELVMEALRRGAWDYIAKPFRNEELLLTLRKAREHQRLRAENERLRERALPDDDLLAEFRSPVMRDLIETLRRIAPYRASVLLSGESGTGKERVARLIHNLSGRSGSFIGLNCAAIPESLIESELFGHARGAFTDARQERRGLFESAEGGTLLLDEIGELPLPLQPKLLRVLQENEIRRVGEARDRPIDVRIIAAGVRPLHDLVNEGRFREDLYYRLNVVPLHVPPLRERREDIPPLVHHFIHSAATRFGKEVEGPSPAALGRLCAHLWPGNVRELENTIERSVLLCSGSRIQVEDLQLGPDQAPLAESTGTPSDGLLLDGQDLSIKNAMRRVESFLIGRALERTGGRRGDAAALLEISTKALAYKVRDYFGDDEPSS